MAASSKLRAQVARVGGGIVAAALLIAVPFIVGREGESLQAYRDVAGVLTICHGETQGVRPGMRMTKEQCRALTDSRVGQFMAKVAEMITVPVTPETLAAHTSMAYNVGVAGYARSMTLRETNKGNVAEGCRAMMNWHTAGGKDCRVRANRCYGLINRRTDEIKLCLSGLE